MTTSLDTTQPLARPLTAIHSPVVGIWTSATVTAAAAIFFPKIEGVRNHGHSPWSILWFFLPQDLEGLILMPIVVGATFAVFRLVGPWALRGEHGDNRPARVGLVTGVVGLVGIGLFWLSAPIVLGGLALMLGLAGRRLAPVEGRSAEATAAIALGLLAAIAGAVMWSFIT